MYYLLTATLFVVLIGCQSANHTKEAVISNQQDNKLVTDATLSNTYWKLTELNGQVVIVDTTRTREPHMIIQTQDSTIKGHGGCNGFGGHVEWKEPNRIKFSKLISTMMACEKMETESLFFKALETADNYYIVGDTLILNKARMAPLARFQAVYLR